MALHGNVLQGEITALDPQSRQRMKDIIKYDIP
jgi:hypothetical protein